MTRDNTSNLQKDTTPNITEEEDEDTEEEEENEEFPFEGELLYQAEDLSNREDRKLWLALYDDYNKHWAVEHAFREFYQNW